MSAAIDASVAWFRSAGEELPFVDESGHVAVEEAIGSQLP
jgi:hypothetical protein